MVSARLPFMTRLPKKRGIIQDGEDETLTAHALLIYRVNSAETTFASIGAASDQDIP